MEEVGNDRLDGGREEDDYYFQFARIHIKANYLELPRAIRNPEL